VPDPVDPLFPLNYQKIFLLLVATLHEVGESYVGNEVEEYDVWVNRGFGVPEPIPADFSKNPILASYDLNDYATHFYQGSVTATLSLDDFLIERVSVDFQGSVTVPDLNHTHTIGLRVSNIPLTGQTGNTRTYVVQGPSVCNHIDSITYSVSDNNVNYSTTGWKCDSEVMKSQIVISFQDF